MCAWKLEAEMELIIKQRRLSELPNKRRAWRRDELDPGNTVIRRPGAVNNLKGEGGSSGSGNGRGGSHLAVAVENLRKRRRLVAPAIPGNGRGAAKMLAELRDQADPGGDAG